MSPSALVAMAVTDLAAAKPRSLISAVGIALGVAAVAIVVALGLGAEELILEKIVQKLPVDTIEVMERSVDLGLFRLDSEALFGERVIDDRVVQQLREIPGVKQAYPKLEVALPLGARGGSRFFGRSLYTDLFMTGLPSELVQQEVGAAFADLPDVIPIVISNQLIEIYNSSVAPSLGTPKLTAHTLTGFEFEVVVGRSLMLGTRHAKRTGLERARIVGASRYAMRLGVTVPMETARRLLATYGQQEAGGRYRSVLLRAKSPAAVPQITRAAESLGFAVDQQAERTRDLLTVATALASAVGLLVLALAALNIAHSFFASLNERRHELAVLRAVGAKRRDLVLLVLIQASLLGLLGGVTGVALAVLGAHACDAAAATLLPDFPFKPETFFLFPPWLPLAGITAAVLAAMLGALWPAVQAARAPVARALAEV